MNDNPVVKALSDYAVIFISAHHGWGVVGFIVVILGVGVVIGWIVTQLRAEAERKKFSAESTSLQLSNLEKFHQYEKKYDDAQQVLNLQLGYLVDMFRRDDINRIDETREELVNHLSHDYLNSWGYFLECYVLFKTRRECVRHVETDILKAVTNLVEICAIIDKPDILSKLNKRTPLKLSRQSLEKVWSFCDKLHFWNILSQCKLYKLKKQFRDN